MANTPMMRGISAASVTCGDLTISSPDTLVLEDIKVSGSSKEDDLAGNNEGQTIVDSNISEMKQEASFEFEANDLSAFPIDLMGQSMAISVTTDPSYSHTSVTKIATGLVTSAEVDIVKSGWHKITGKMVQVIVTTGV